KVDHRAAGPRITAAGTGLRELRRYRPAADPITGRRPLPPLPRPPAGRGLPPLRGGEAGPGPRRAPAAAVWLVQRPTPASVWPLRADPPHRPPRPRRAARHLQRLLPTPGRDLQPLRTNPPVHPCRRARTGLRLLRSPTRHGLRTLRTASPADRPLARRTGLRPLLQRRAAAPRHLRRLRADPSPGRPAWPRRHHLRRLRRAAGQPRLHRLRHRGQAPRTRPPQPARAAP